MNRHLVGAVPALVLALIAAVPLAHAGNSLPTATADRAPLEAGAASPAIDTIRHRGTLVIGSELKFPCMNVKDPATGRNEGTSDVFSNHVFPSFAP